MKKIKQNHPVEYLCPTLILSYFILHNIFLVMIGIGFSLYLININFINNLIRSLNSLIVIKKELKAHNNNETKSDYSNIDSYKNDTKMTLVETIEELGFIPSLDEKDNDKAA